MSWWIKILLDLAIKMGLPWLMEKLAWVPSEIWVAIRAAIEAIANAENKPEALANANRAFSACSGSFCPPSLKTE